MADSLRDTDPLAYEVLAALQIAAITHSSSSAANGTKPAVSQPYPHESDTWLTTADAAAEMGITDRAIRKEIATERLPARRHGGRWLIDRENLNIRTLAA